MTDSGDPIETELKLKISPDAVARLMRHSLLRRLGSGKPARKRLVSTYFDTPDLRLMHHRVALRVRKIGQRRVQTVKCAPDASGGTAARLEWEVDVGGDRPDLGAAHIERIENRNLRKLLGADKVRDRLQPLFVTDFRRTTWPLRLKGSAIELAVDVGEIKSANGRMPICEAELELKSGDRAGLYALARKLRKSIPFTVEPMSKAERGYALAAHADPRAHKAAPLRLDRAATVAETVLRIGRNCLLHLRANEAAVRAGDVTEGVHQMRVAVRRLRSALSAFRGILGKDDRRQIGGGLRWIARQCAAAREWDVFRDELLAPLRERLTADPALKLYADAVDVACADAHAKVTAMLAGKRYTEALLQVDAWLEDGEWRAAAGEAGEESARDFARAALKKLHRRVDKLGSRLAELKEADLHDLRIRVKKLRYTAEFFRSLYPNRLARDYLDALAAIQDRLGSLNDGVMVTHLLHAVEKREPDMAPELLAGASGIVTGWSSALIEADLEKLPTAWARFAETKPFWK